MLYLQINFELPTLRNISSGKIGLGCVSIAPIIAVDKTVIKFSR